MSGRKQFNETEALDAATRQFWQYGYARSSIHDLERATGLNKSSLYNTFQSKDALYLRCLTHFDDAYVTQLMSILGHSDFQTGLAQFFDALLDGFESPERPEGCLATHAALEMSRYNAPINAKIQASLQNMLGLFTARCEQAVQAEHLPADCNCEALAATIVAISRGAIVLYMGTRNTHASRQACDFLLKSLQ